jgi:hypothetical protein
MKKILIHSKLIILSATILLLGSCAKDDTTAPIISLIGDAEVNYTLEGGSYIELGATAVDDEDGEVEVTISGQNEVNTDSAGVYEVTYTAIDEAGNIATEIRTVNVINSSAIFDGSYNCTITEIGQPDYTYSDVLRSSSTQNWISFWDKFGDYPNANGKFKMEFTSGNQINIPTQLIECGITPAFREFSGSGTKSGNQITLFIEEKVNNQTKNFTYIFTKN